MASLKDIKRRMTAVKNTQKVTRAMKLVAAARLKKAQQLAVNSRAFSSELYASAMRVSRKLGSRAPLLYQRPKRLNCIDLIIITSDRGLCGGFNENLLSLAEEGIVNIYNHDISAKLFVVGRKGVKYLSPKNYAMEIVSLHDGLSSAIDLLVKIITQRYLNGESAGCNIAFNKFTSLSKQKPTFWNLLPLHKRGLTSEKHLEYLYEPKRSDALNSLCQLVISSSIRQALVESNAAELAARMLAMDNATKNADDVLSHLTFVYNRLRQEKITSDLMDIVGGAEALR